MTMSRKYVTFDELILKYREFDDWIGSSGITLMPTHIQNIHNDYKILIRKYKRYTSNKYDEDADMRFDREHQDCIRALYKRILEAMN
jgi:hypothetical protein